MLVPNNSPRSLWETYLNKSSDTKISSQQNAEKKALKKFTKNRFSGNILGIDPSLRATGLAIISIRNSEEYRLIHSETITNKPSLPMLDCLGEIHRHFQVILQKYNIDQVACEESIYVQNFQTAQILGAARGSALGIISSCSIPISEYSPLRIKQAVVGYGRASKKQVSQTIKTFLQLTETLEYDQSDACAVAICHALSGN